MAWVDSDTSRPQYNAEGQLIGYAGSSAVYQPESFDSLYNNSGFVSQPMYDGYGSLVGWTEAPPQSDAVIRERMKAAALGAIMGPGTTNGQRTVESQIGNLRALMASDPRFAQYLPSEAELVAEAKSLVGRQQAIDNANEFDFGNVLLGGAAAGIGALSGGFGLSDLLKGFDFGSPSFSVSSGGIPTQVAGWSSDMPFNIEDYFSALEDAQALPSGSGSLMPAAIPETPSQLAEWGLKEVSPGVWSQPAMPDISMSASDWFKLAKNIPGLQFILGGSSAVDSSNSLSRLLSGDASGSDWLSTIGKLAPSLLGAYASSQQSSRLADLAQKYQDFGAPYRSKLAEISADPNAFYNSDGAQKATNAVLNRLSIGGNPAGSANKQALTIDALYNEYGKERDRLARYGGLTQYNAAAPALDAQAVGSNANMYNAIGAGINDIFNPKPALPDLLKQMKQAGF